MTKLLVGLLLATITFAQQTWSGLRFGMSQAEVRAALKEKWSAPLPEDKLSPGTRFVLGGLVRGIEVDGLSGDASLLFCDDGKRLCEVTIVLNPRKDKPDMDVQYEFLRADLAKKYGAPISGARCPADSSCDTIFRSEGQAITLNSYRTRGKVIIVYLSYEPANVDKPI